MSAPGGIDFEGRSARPRGRGLIAGILLLGAGLAVAGYAAWAAIGQADAIRDDAVATGQTTGEAVAFESAARELTLYLDFEGAGALVDSAVEDAAVLGTTCRVGGATLRGDRQGGTRASVGRLASVGSFVLEGGPAHRLRHRALHGPPARDAAVRGHPPRGLGGGAPAADRVRRRRRADRRDRDARAQRTGWTPGGSRSSSAAAGRPTTLR